MKKGHPAQRTTGSRQYQLNPPESVHGGHPGHGFTRNHVCHGKQKQRDSQHHADPKPPRHVRQFGAFLIGIRCNRPCFQGHSADWAVSRFLTHHLRVHRACVLDTRAGLGGTRRGRFERHSALRTATGIRVADFGVHWARIDCFGPAFIPEMRRKLLTLHVRMGRVHVGRAIYRGLVQVFFGVCLEFFEAVGTAKEVRLTTFLKMPGRCTPAHHHSAHRVQARLRSQP